MYIYNCNGDSKEKIKLKYWNSQVKKMEKKF